MLRVSIIGGSGYTGVELLRLLGNHPEVCVAAATSRQHAGTAVAEVFPSLRTLNDLVFVEPDTAAIRNESDIVFTAVPHQTAMSVVPELLDAGLRVIDLSADFRLRDQAVYEEWYQAHSAPHLLKDAAYGLPEIYGQDVAKARLVANPGCYPTSAALPLVPLLRAGFTGTDGIVIDSKSGVSGAGRSPSLAALFCEANEAFMAYKVASHRHTPEIEQELSAAAGSAVTVNFTPHLVPMSRGILTTIYAACTKNFTTGEVLEALGNFYRSSPFVRVLPEGAFPNASYVRGSNFCDIGAKVDKRTGRLILISTIDNLVKGASGQAVQNMNIMAGLDETCGLKGAALYP